MSRMLSPTELHRHACRNWLLYDEDVPIQTGFSLEETDLTSTSRGAIPRIFPGSSTCRGRQPRCAVILPPAPVEVRGEEPTGQEEPARGAFSGRTGNPSDRGLKRLAGPGDRVDALPQLPPFSIEQKEPVSLAQGNVPQVSPVLHGDEGIDPGVRGEGKRIAPPGKAALPVPVPVDPEYGALENRCRVGFLGDEDDPVGPHVHRAKEGGNVVRDAPVLLPVEFPDVGDRRAGEEADSHYIGDYNPSHASDVAGYNG